MNCECIDGLCACVFSNVYVFYVFLSDISQALIKSNTASHTLLNGFLYQDRTSANRTWAGLRQSCASLGGDVAMHGVKTLENRR